ncbi:MAG: hypothetical protein HKN73_07915 [Gemmatimonadetes bacterium]|nr:hypothetical protein [Gemmatimonadota bacterium]
MLGPAEDGTFSCLPAFLTDEVQESGPFISGQESTLPRRTLQFVPVALLSVLLAGCAAFLANTDVAMLSLGPVAVQGGGEKVQASFRVVNHNSTPSQLVGVLYRMDLRESGGRWAELTEGYSVQAVSLPPGQPADVTFTLDGLAVDRVPAHVVDQGAYRLVGELRVIGGLGEVQVPFSFPSGDSEDSGLFESPLGPDPR